MSFKKPQWNLYKLGTSCALRKCPLYGDVRFIESLSENQISSKVNMKFTICDDFRSPDLLEGPKDGKIRENANFFHSEVFKQDSQH